MSIRNSYVKENIRDQDLGYIVNSMRSYNQFEGIDIPKKGTDQQTNLRGSWYMLCLKTASWAIFDYFGV